MLRINRKWEADPKKFYNDWHTKHSHTQAFGLELLGRRGGNTNFIRRLNDTIALCHGSVLDVGCQRGAYVKHLRINPNVTDVIGLDISEVVIHQAKLLQPGVSFIVGDIMNLPFRDNSFDTVLASETLEHLTQPGLAALELMRVTRNQTIVSVPNEPKTISDPTHLRFFEIKDLTDLFRHWKVELIETKAVNHIIRITK